MTAQRQKMIGDRGAQLLWGRIASRDDVSEIVDEVQNTQLADRKECRLFRLQVLVEACSPNPETLSDLSRASAEIAPLGKAHSRSIEDLPIAVLPLRTNVRTRVEHT